MKNVISTINYIVSQSTELKNTFTNISSVPVEFSCIFCQNEEEYERFMNEIKILGRIVERTQSGFTYLLDKPIQTIAGPLRLVKIRKPDVHRIEKGDADFNTDYKKFKDTYQNNSGFELVKRETFEMLRLTNLEFDVMACFSNVPKSKVLGIEL